MSEAPVTDLVSFSLNGKTVQAKKGMTVMQVAQRENVAIPHFCWHPGLSVAGVCRFCMVEVEGRPKLEIACNLPVVEGMVVKTNTPKAEEAHKWALEFHLVNHPLDCPICDQAGECGLQDYYMKVGKYQSQMTRPKVLKPKALDVGGDLVLDTERCILCSRCVRFEEEVTKTAALGIFDRGDRSIIGTYPGKKIDHNYTDNIVDICPVGAFTSKDFRFKQRVWFLKEQPTTCAGCSTGCQVSIHAKPEVGKFFRLKPRKSDINGHWMCDKGRKLYSYQNKENRLLFPKIQGKAVSLEEVVADLAAKIKATPAGDTTLLVSAQYTVEEYRSFFNFFVKKLGIKKVLQWREPTENRFAFDGILYRGDHNANTTGLLQVMKEFGLETTVKSEFDSVATAKSGFVIALAPEVPSTFPSLDQQLRSLSELPFVSVWMAGVQAEKFPLTQVIPMKTFGEKNGTFVNHEGKNGAVAGFPSQIKYARSVTEIVTMLETML